MARSGPGWDGDTERKGKRMTLRGRLALLAVVPLVALGAVAPAAGARESAIVAMGDSAISGESAGNYEPGTDQAGNYCHRSLDALIHETAIAHITTTLKLAQVAGGYRVRLVVVEVGANDDPAFGRVATSCVTAYVFQTTGCRYTEGATWANRVAAAMPKVARALDDVRTVMRAAGYADSSWQAVLASYWSPVPRPPIRYSGYLSKLWNGCPLYNADMEWGHDTAVPTLSEALGKLAASKGWRFLNFSRSMDGRQICAQGITHSQEWTTGTKYDPSSSYR